MCIYHFKKFIHLRKDTLIGSNSTTINMVIQLSFWFIVFKFVGMYPGMWSMDHMGNPFLIFKEISTLLPAEVALIYIPTTLCKCPIVHTLASICYFLCWILAILTGVTSLWFWFAFPWWLVMLNFFLIYLLAFVFLLLTTVFWSLLSITQLNLLYFHCGR